MIGGWLGETMPLEGLRWDLGDKVPAGALGAWPAAGVGQGRGVGQAGQCGWRAGRESQRRRCQRGGAARRGTYQALLGEEAVERVTERREERWVQGPVTELSLPHALHQV